MPSLVDDRLPHLDAGEDSVRSITLPAEPSAAPLARSFIREHTVLDSMRYTEADLLITEMICNVVRHAGFVDEIHLTVDLSIGRTVSISLAHDFTGPLIDPDPGAGFTVLDRLSHDWGHDHDGERLRVWFALRRPGSISRHPPPANERPEGAIDVASDVLIRRHRDLAIAIARRYRGKGVADEDLEQVALLGLLKAIQRYDAAVGDLRPYAAVTISGELKRWLRDKGWSVRVPRSVQELVLQVKRSSDELTQSLGRQPTRGEIADHLDLEESEILEAGSARSAYTSRSADQEIPGTEWTLLDGLQDASCQLKDAEDRLVLEGAISRLPDRQRLIMSLRFNEDMNQSEIADVVGISQVHVSRLLSKAFQSMRLVLADLEPEEG
jgi:RNA polymerase sigma-B factor